MSSQPTATRRGVRKSRKQDPLWSEMLQAITKAHPNAKRLLTHPAYIGQDASICAIAEAILKRPPRLSDLDEDLLLVVVRRFHRQYIHTKMVRQRIARLMGLAAHATERFNHPAIGWDDMPLARRITISWLDRDRAEVAIPSTDTIPDDFDKSMLGTPLDRVLDEYIREKLLGKSTESVRLMRAAVQSFGRHLGRVALLGDLRKGIIVDYITAKLKSGLAAASVQSYRERLVSLWAFAFKRRWLPDFPDVPKVKAPERTPEAWTQQELEALLAAAKAAEGTFGVVPSRLYFAALIYFIYDTGERIGAVRQIRYDDLKKDAQGETWVTIRAELRKGRTRDKPFKLRRVTVDAIEAIRATAGSDPKMPFACALSKTYIYAVFGKIIEAAELPNNRRTKFHKIRRTVASDFEAAGGNATELLDHDSRRTTKRSYLDPKVIRSVQPADIVAGIGEKPLAPPKQPDAELLAKIRGMLTAAEVA